MTEAAKHRPWTIMIYMAGDNGRFFDTPQYGRIQLMASMSDQVDSDLLKMGRVGTTDSAAVVCLADTLHGSFQIEVRPGRGFADSQVTALDSVDTGNPDTLSRFLTQSIQNYPADHTMLVIWNHGAGWLDVDAYSVVRALGPGKSHRPIFRTTPQQLAGPARTRPIAFDDSSKDFLDTAGLRKAFGDAQVATGVRLDIIGMDACLMAMVEGDRELAPYADYFVASQEVEPMYGWPYAEILTDLNAQPTMVPADLARTVVVEYAKHYGGTTRGGDESATQAATALADTERTEVLCKGLVDGILQNKSATVRRLVTARALANTLKFEDPNYRDLGDFALQTARAFDLQNDKIQAAAQALYDHLQARGAGSPVLNVGFVDAYERATGMSVFLPDSLPDAQRESTLAIYRKLYFPQRTGWDKLVAWLLTGDS